MVATACHGERGTDDARSSSSGPSRSAPIVDATAADAPYTTALSTTMDATAAGLEPVPNRMPAPIAAPTIVITDPDVVDSALAVTRSCGSTTCGNAADSAERKNRLTPSATT